jgi:hypothetical protein
MILAHTVSSLRKTTTMPIGYKNEFCSEMLNYMKPDFLQLFQDLKYEPVDLQGV